MLFKLFHTESQGYQDLTPDEVNERLRSGDKVTLIDVRSAREYASGHLPKAKLVPLGELRDRHTEIHPDRDVIVYCHSSARSRRAASMLVKLGHGNVFNMSRGIQAWQGQIAH
ncbi:MAG: rhodanese-like domain-containing protein [Thermoleophilia bacterium]|nr:rhodanese-like domain-containing protein [Thermoleophilia bacterium]